MTNLKHAPRVRHFQEIPAAPEAEAALLGCIFIEPATIKHLLGKPIDLFHDLRNAEVFGALKTFHKKGKTIEMVSFLEWLKTEKILKQSGGWEYVAALPDKCHSPANWNYWLEILQEKHALRRMLEVCRAVPERIANYEGAVAGLMLGIRADMETISALGLRGEERRALKIWKASELKEFVPPDHLELVGDNEVFMGYEGVVVFAGPGSSGKSLAAAALALAGARGNGFWMGRKVHRQFKTLVIQAENGKRRLKNMLGMMTQNHPEIDIENHVFFSEPPEGGLPFETNDFRAGLREEVARIKPALVILDPWSHVGCEDSADAIKAKLTEIRSCFPYGDDCPCLMIIAHTKKPRAEDVRRGRGLMYMVSGSINLVNTARCCYVMLPWTDDIEDKRVYFATPKLNDGANYAPTVWQRRFGTFFEHDDKTDPKDFGKEGEAQNGKVTEEHLRQAFGDAMELKTSKLVANLEKISGAGTSTCWRVIGSGEGGYLREFLRPGRAGMMGHKFNMEAGE